MIPAADLWTVSYIIAGIVVVATGAGVAMLRLLAARSTGTILTVIAAVAVTAMLAGVVLIAKVMSISHEDLDAVLTVVAVPGITGFAVSLSVGRRLSEASRVLLGAVREAAISAEYQPPRVVLPADLAVLSHELEKAHCRLAQARARERALEASRRDLIAWISHDLRTPLAALRAVAEALEDSVVTQPQMVDGYHTQIRAETDRLTLMIDDLFELSHLNAGALPPLSRIPADHAFRADRDAQCRERLSVHDSPAARG